jgi:hypothetical protein
LPEPHPFTSPASNPVSVMWQPDPTCLEAWAALLLEEVAAPVGEEALVARLAGRGRADDNARTIRHRLGVFASSTRPLLDYYGGQGLLFSVVAEGTIDEVSERILHAPRDVSVNAAGGGSSWP